LTRPPFRLGSPASTLHDEAQMTVINKNTLKQTLISIETQAIEQANQAYRNILGEALVDRSQTIDLDELAYSATNRDLATQYESKVHEHTKLKKRIEAIDFAPVSTIQEGAVVKLSGQNRYLVISVHTNAFTCQGETFLGISKNAPLFEAMEGLEEGDVFDFGDRELEIEYVG